MCWAKERKRADRSNEPVVLLLVCRKRWTGRQFAADVGRRD